MERILACVWHGLLLSGGVCELRSGAGLLQDRGGPEGGA